MISKPLAFLAFLALAGLARAASPEAVAMQEVQDRLKDPSIARLTHGWMASDRALERLDARAASLEVAPAAGIPADLDAAYEREVARRRWLLDESLDLLFPPANRLPSGTVVTLEHPAFGRAAYSLGLYAPDLFEGRIGGGIHLLEPFDPERDVVLLIHGINGGPRDFVDLVTGIDRTKYQVWVAYFPTGLEIPEAASFLERHLRSALAAHPARRVLAVAHSLGGLVWRQLLASASTPLPIGSSYFLCTPHRGVRFITFDLVKLGCRILWRVIPRPVDDLLEGSDYLKALDSAPPLAMPVRTAAGTVRVELRSRLVGSLIPVQNDGLVPLTSTPLAGSLDHRPMREDHYSILYSPVFRDVLASWLDLDRTR